MVSKKVQVAYLSYDGLTDPLGQSQIIPYLIGLTKHGFDFTIISFEKPERYLELSEQINSQLNDHKIRWHPLRYTKRPPVLSTLWDVLKLWRTFVNIHKDKDFKIVHCRSYITSLIGLRAKRKFGTKFIFDMRGFWADERVEGELWDLKNPLYRTIYRFFKKKEKQFLVKADQTISLTENAKREILSWDFKCSPITVIPTCVDLEIFNPSNIRKEDQDKIKKELGIQDDNFVLLYLGSWGTWYLTDDMLRFFVDLKKQRTTAKFLIVSTDKVDLQNYEMRKDVIHTQVARKLVPLYISIANLAVCFIKPTFSKKASSATKIGEILTMDVPIMVNNGWGDIADIVKKSLIHPSPFPKEFYQINSSDLIIEYFDLNSGIAEYSITYNKLITE